MHVTKQQKLTSFIYFLSFKKKILMHIIFIVNEFCYAPAYFNICWEFLEDIFLIPVDRLYRWLGVQATYPRYKQTM